MNFHLPFTIRACFQCLVLMAIVAGSNATGPKPIYAIYLSLSARVTPWEERVKGMLTDAERQGYQAVFLNFGGCYRLKMGAGTRMGVSPEKIAEILRYAREHGLEPINYVPMVCNQKHLKDLLEKYPGIVHFVHGREKDSGFVWDPLFKLPDGRSIYDGVIYPLIDELLGCYGERPPKYFHIACDECDKYALKIVAQKENLTAGKLLAREINRVTSYLIKKNITPIMWGDTFLSAKLAKPGLVRGFAGDPRFADHPTAMFGDGVMDGVDDLVNRDKIIIADWHYYGGTSAGEYPSVDYFKKLGFKDVWGATWFGEKHIAEFAKYAASRNCGGMIATTWFTNSPDFPPWDCFYPTILRNSIVCFKNPNVTPCVRPKVFAYGPGAGKTILFPAGSTVTLFATTGDTVKIASEPVFSVRKHDSPAMKQDNPIMWEATIPGKIERSGNSSVIKASFAIPQSDAPGKAYDVKLEYIGENQLLYQGYEEALFAVGK